MVRGLSEGTSDTEVSSGEVHALRTALTARERRGGRRVALIHEGGGMRGAFGAGVLTGLSEAGVRYDAFDGVFGVSAGILNLAYWISHRPRDATRVYTDEILTASDPPFFLYHTLAELFLRLVRGQPAIDLRAVERTMRVRRPIDLDLVRDARIPIWFPITHARELTTAFLDARTLDRDAIIRTIVASTAVPGLADCALIGDTEFLDGACGAPLPMREALAHGYTDLVVVLTLPRRQPPAWYEPHLLRMLASRRGLSPRVAEIIRRGRRARKAALETLARTRSVRVTLLAPPTRPAATLERDRAVLERAVETGIAVARDPVSAARAG